MKPATVHATLANAVQELERSGIASARLDASLLLAHVLELSREQLVLNHNKQLNDNQINAFLACIRRRAQHEPIAYIIGKKEFWSLDFFVTNDTLIPRPDSETLIEAALKRVQRLRQEHARERATPTDILDIATGTGCLLVALLKELPQATGIGADNSERALRVAEENARRHGVASRATFIQSNWCDAIHGTFDLILSNPPYIAASAMATLMPDVLNFEPHSALVAGEDGLDAYRAIMPQVPQRLKPGGYALFEVGQGQAGAVSGLLRAQGLAVEEAEKDLAGVERCVVARKRIIRSSDNPIIKG